MAKAAESPDFTKSILLPSWWCREIDLSLSAYWPRMVWGTRNIHAVRRTVLERSQYFEVGTAPARRITMISRGDDSIMDSAYSAMSFRKMRE